MAGEKYMKKLFAQRVLNNSNSYINDIFKNSANPQNISFAGGFPDQDLFPSDQLEEAYRTAIANSKPDIFQYQSVQGSPSLRQKIANRMIKNSGMMVSSENILLTQGGQQAIDLTAKLLLNKGDSIVVEAPTYMGALTAFDMYEPVYHEIPIDKDGMQIDILEQTLKKYPKIKLIYTIPDFQNPTGTLLTSERRKKMVELANKYDVMILEDSPYRELKFEGDSVPPVKYYDTEDRVIFISSFSKILSPALRTGWMIAGKGVMERLLDLKSATDLQSPAITLAAVDQYLSDNDIDQHIKEMTDVYRQKRNVMLSAIKRYFPKEITYTIPHVGFFVWVTLPQEINSTQLLIEKVLPDAHVAYVPSDSQYVSKKITNAFRLNYTGLNPTIIEEGIKKLGEVLRKEIQLVQLKIG